MENMILFNTSVASQNMGDYIIVDCAKKELENIMDDKFVVELPTHVPSTHFYQQFNKNKLIEFANNSKIKLVLGTNLLAYDMLRPWPNFNVNIFNSKIYKNTTLVGVGSNPNKSKVNFYTKKLYKKILSTEMIHSVRDEKTKLLLENMGFKALNTGCITMWKFTPEFCKQIPSEKANNVIFTLTDYCKDSEKDQKLIDILNKNYDKVYFWIQGSEDLSYFKSLKNTKNIELVAPNLESYKKVLEQDDLDYIGTRLHAGMYALRYKKRSIILSIDNRTRDIKETYNIISIERDNIDDLEHIINSSLKFDIRIPMESINEWKNQFK